MEGEGPVRNAVGIEVRTFSRLRIGVLRSPIGIDRILSRHRQLKLSELPGQDVAREVVEHGRQIEPALTNQVSKIGLPELVVCGVGWAKLSAAFIRIKPGLVIRSCAFKSLSVANC